MNTLLTSPSDPSLLALYQYQEDHCNTQVVETTTGEPTVILDDHWNFYRLAIIDEFVRLTLETDQPGYVAVTGINGRVTWHRQAWIESHFQRVTGTISPLMNDQFDVRNVFVELFLKACSELGICDWTSYVLSYPARKQAATAQALNELIETIRLLAKRPPYPSKIWHARNDWKRNATSCSEFVGHLYGKRSRYTVVRVDLAYLKEFAFDVFTADARADLAHLLKMMRRGKRRKNDCRERELFGNLAGYIWKLEYGTDRLLHFHWFLFFSEKNGMQAGYWAQEIGQYWIDVITQGRGTSKNCNYRWYGHPDEGIGEVNRNDARKRDNLQKAIGYLFKPDQALPIRTSDPRYRTFGKGML
jgi:hypothetical protein